MAIVIDSSVLIAAERGTLDLQRLLEEHADERAAIAAITASELLHGVHRMKRAVERAHAQLFVDRLLEILPVLPFDLDVARVHAGLSADLGRRGVAVGANDLMIAATAVQAGAGVATRDRRSFPKIAGLNLLFW